VHRLFIISGITCFLFLLGFAITTFFENEKRAGGLMCGLAAAYLVLWFSIGFLIPDATLSIVRGFWILVAAGIILLSLPFGKPQPLEIDPAAAERFDERHVIFGRMELAKGTPQYDTYYSELNPQMKGFDDHLRSMPKLGEPGGYYFHEYDTPYFDAVFEFIANYNHLAQPGLPATEPKRLTPQEATRRIKGFAGHLGALDVRITRLRDYHAYSHTGRKPTNWGQKITPGHTYAIVISAEMSHQMVHSAPDVPAATESSVQYMRLANIGIILATYLSRLGYQARAHIDGNYHTLVTALAHEAGIGELSRMGLIITPSRGPRIRLAAVTTDLELIEDKPVNFGVQHFSEICKKCAENCPSNSIQAGDKQKVRGVVKWQSQMETCYKYWRTAGTDCAVCMAVCPYSKPATFYHNIIRFFCTRNPVARWIILQMDDFFYSRTPRHHDRPDWFAK